MKKFLAVVMALVAMTSVFALGGPETVNAAPQSAASNAQVEELAATMANAVATELEKALASIKTEPAATSPVVNKDNVVSDGQQLYEVTLYDMFQIYPDNRENDDVFIAGYTLDGYHTPIEFPYTVKVAEVKSRYNASELGFKPTLDAVAYDVDEDDSDAHIGLWISGLGEGDLDDYKETGMPISVREIRFTDGATEFIGQNLPSMNTKYLTLPASVEYMHNEAFYYPFTAKVIDFDETLVGSKSNEQLVIEKNAFYYNDLEEINFPEKDLVIGDYAFTYSELKKVSFPKDHKVSFGNYCFAATNLKEFSFPEKTVHIGKDILGDVELDALFVPASVFDLMYKAFEEGTLFDLFENLIAYNIYIDVPSTVIPKEQLQAFADEAGSQIYLNDMDGFRRF